MTESTVGIRYHDLLLRGTKVHFAEAGNGPPLILIHGFIVSHKEWLPILPILSQKFRCIVPDLPGFGASEKLAPDRYPYTREAFAETVADLMSALGLTKAHVCGHSMGGSIALTFAADRPELVDRLLVIDSACYPFDLPFKGRLPFLPFVGPIVFKQLYGRALFRDYFKNDVWSGHTGIDMKMVDSYYDDFNTPQSREAAYACMKNTVDLSSLGPKLSRIRAQTLIVWGDDDRIFPVSLAHRLVREVPNATLKIIESCGHAPNEEKIEETSALILQYLGASTRGAD